MSVDSFLNDLLGGLPEHPVHVFEFHRFSHPTQEEIQVRKNATDQPKQKNRKQFHLHFRLNPFDHKELEPSHAGDVHQGPLKKYVSFTVFNANLNQPEDTINHMYLLGALQNVAMLSTIYPGWIPLIYIDETSYVKYKEVYDWYIFLMLKARPDAMIILVRWLTVVPRHQVLNKKYDLKLNRRVDLASTVAMYMDRDARYRHQAPNIKLQFIKTLWRFFPASYRCIMISRDTDSRVNMREALAVDEWVNSGYPLHRIFDSVFYANPLLAGLWGAKPHCPRLVSAGQGREAVCSPACVAIPNLRSMLNEFLTSQNLIKGYGIDELFLGMEAKLSHAKLYTDIMTHGYGAFFSSVDKDFTLFKDYQSIKLGRRMYSLVPVSGPSFPSVKKAFRKLPSGTYLGLETSFVGENIIMDGHLPKWTNLIIEQTMTYAVGKCSATPNWKNLLKKFGLKIEAKKFEKDLKRLTIIEFLNHYSFDKRFLPQFWYCFDRVMMHETYTFTRIFTTNPSEYEIRVLEEAYREAALHQPDVARLFNSRISNTEYYNRYVPILKKLAERRSVNLKVDNQPVDKFFQVVCKVLQKKSHVFPYLDASLKMDYWEGALVYYPFSALRVLNLEF